MKFNEWMTKRDGDLNELGGSNLGISIKHDYELLASQLSQIKDRVRGLLHDIEPPKRDAILDGFLKDVKKECAA